MISNELASAIDDRRCFCSRGGRHFDTPVAQQRSHTRKPFEFFFSVSDKLPKEILRDVEEEKKAEKDKTSRIVNCRTHDRWGPESRNLQSRSSGKKKLGCLSLLKNAHTTSNKVNFTDGSESETFLPVSSSSNTADSLAINVCGHPVR